MIRLRAMTPRDIDSGVALTQQLHWPHRREDWQQALTFGAGTVAEHQGDYAGSALGFRWGEQAATIGLVIVSPRWQGQGIGKQLMLALLEQFPDYRLRLHATESGKPLYQKLGFAVTGQILQHQTRALAAVPALTVPAGFTLRHALPAEAQPLTAFDHQAHGLWRPALITHLIAAAQTRILLDAQQRVQGFASLRRFGHGWSIGPVIALNLLSAQTLIAALMQTLRGEFVRIDTDAALPLAPWLKTLGLEQVDAPTIMVRGTPWMPQPGAMLAYGLMTQAMG